MAQLMWVRDHLADIESDLSAVHRIDDMWSVPAARFFRLAWRLPAYRGVMRERMLAHRQRDDTVPAVRAPARQPRPAGAAAAGREPEPVTAADLSDPVLGTLFSFG